jgi:antitoxin (DNA-binding transcriptional repressor) of toxin-antitoxin stability system
MPKVGVRELKARAWEIIRDVRERRTRYVISHRGCLVALLIPLEDSGSSALPAAGEPSTAAWDDLVRLGEEIGRGWHSPLTGAGLLSEMRR